MITPETKIYPFKLEESTISAILNYDVDWSDNTLGLVTLYRTYLRNKPDGSLETWNDCVIRVIEGMFTIQKTHIINNLLIWDESRAQRTAKDAAIRLLQFKWTPPGRGLWMMGTDFVYTRGGMCLNNCAFISTGEIAETSSEPFRFLMDASMLGVGVGFDTDGAKKIIIKQPNSEINNILVEDSRGGWVDAIGSLIDSYFIENTPEVIMDVSNVRAYGEPIKGFGGVASGPDTLVQGFNGIKDILRKRIGNPITSSDIVDIQNIIGKIVIAGNVRRSAEIALGSFNDPEFRELKSWSKWGVETGAELPLELKEESEEDFQFLLENRYTPEGRELIERYKDRPWAYKIGGWRWASNNTVFATPGVDYTEIEKAIAETGEPGLFFLENARNYSRMCDLPDYKDHRVKGTNPCGEQSLESGEICCLVETYPSHHSSAKDYYDTLKIAYLYAKTVTLVATHNPKTNIIISRNRRIGCSQSGVVDAIAKFGRHYYQKNMLDGAYQKIVEYDKIYSEWLGVPLSIKRTSIKPSGCTLPETKLLFEDGKARSIEELFSIQQVNLGNFRRYKDRNLWFNCCFAMPRVLDMNNIPQKITKLYINGYDSVYDIKLENGEIYPFTGNHRLMVEIDEWKHDWKQVSELVPGNIIYSYKEHQKVVEISKREKEEFTVDVEVENTHSYQLENGCVSHNTVSLVANVSSPGCHFPKVRYGYRTMRMSKDSPIVQILKNANYRIEQSITDPMSTVVVYFPLIGKENVPTDDEVTIWEKFINVVMIQKYWADNQVSVTITFKPEEAKDIGKCLAAFDSELKSVSLMPLMDHGYAQAPYQHANKQEVVEYKKSLKLLDFSSLHHAFKAGENEMANKFCDGDSCQV